MLTTAICVGVLLGGIFQSLFLTLLALSYLREATMTLTHTSSQITNHSSFDTRLNLLQLIDTRQLWNVSVPI